MKTFGALLLLAFLSFLSCSEDRFKSGGPCDYQPFDAVGALVDISEDDFGYSVSFDVENRESLVVYRDGPECIQLALPEKDCGERMGLIDRCLGLHDSLHCRIYREKNCSAFHNMSSRSMVHVFGKEKAL